MLESVKQVAINKYKEELYNFLNNFVKLSLEQKLFRFALLISGFKVHFIDHGKKTPQESNYIKNYRFHVSLSLLYPDKMPAHNEFYIAVEGDDIEKLINKTFEKIINTLTNQMDNYFSDSKYLYMVDQLLNSIDENRLI